ncbi:MAG: hypothetical protein ACFCU4_00175 [Puniceicoccaceae bacterium]
MAIWLLGGLSVVGSAEARLQQIPFEKRWKTENPSADLKMYPKFDTSPLLENRFRSTSRRAEQTISRIQTSTRNQFQTSQESSRYNKIFSSSKQSRFGTDTKFGQSIFLKNNREQVIYGRDDLKPNPMSADWNESFTDFFDWWATQYQDDLKDEKLNLSLEDINRFQFRRGRSSLPGVPVQEAGSGPESSVYIR